MKGNQRTQGEEGEDEVLKVQGVFFCQEKSQVEKVGKQLSVSTSVFSALDLDVNSLWGWTLWEPIILERSTFASCSADGSFKVWDIREKELAGKMARHIGGPPSQPQKRPYKVRTSTICAKSLVFCFGGLTPMVRDFQKLLEVEIFLVASGES